ncbi:hypothetical protein D3C85_1499850 [compost metagenome]
MDIGVAFQAEQFRHLHRADLAGAPQVVAQQVDDHQVLCTILATAQQFGGVARIFSGIAAAWAGTLDRPGFYLAIADLDETLRREAQQRAAIGQ